MSGTRVRPPAGPAGSAPMFHPCLLAHARPPCPGRSRGGATETLAASRAHAPPAPVGVRGREESHEGTGLVFQPWKLGGRKKWARQRSQVTEGHFAVSGLASGSGLNTWPLRASLHPRDPLITDEKTQGHSVAGRQFQKDL